MAVTSVFIFFLVVYLAKGAIFDVNYFDNSQMENMNCDVARLAVYRMNLRTFWSEEKFPKSYPKFRPPAQWSTVFGQSHNTGHSLFKFGAPSSPGLRRFAERGDLRGLTAAPLDKEDWQGDVFDQFVAEPIRTGEGSTQQEVFVDGNHSLISFVCRIVPSPDWFIGVNSVDLCSEGEWLENLTMTLNPLDAGTDGGLTFTSPRWRLQKPVGVYQQTSKFPDHRAASFFYPKLQKLPHIAQIEFTKLREQDYEDSVEEQTEYGSILRPDDLNGTLDIEMVNVNTSLANGSLTDDLIYKRIIPEKEMLSNVTEEILKNIKYSFLRNLQYFPKDFRPKINYTQSKEHRKASSVNSNLLTSFLTTKKGNSSTPSRASYFSW